ncbi:MAG TPA: hypothetical protein ENK52_05995, partial [Saprospiraceae bacterium]|nr:hypothetical protein [Saprospiraceae bacterium]
MSDDVKKTIIRGTLISAFFYPLSILLGFAWNATLSRSLSPEEVGIFALLMTIVGIASTIANHGMAIIANRYPALLEEKNDHAGRRFVQWVSIGSPIIGAIVVAFLLFILKPIFGVFFYPELIPTIVIIMFILPFHSSLSSMVKLFLASRMVAANQLLSLVGMKLLPMLIILAWFELSQTGTAVDAGWAFFCSIAIVWLWGWWWINKSV